MLWPSPEETVPATQDDEKRVEELVCALYNKPGKCMNYLRYTLFCKTTNMQSHQLPPTRGALDKHVQRANYQTFVWKNALEANPTVHDPSGA